MHAQTPQLLEKALEPRSVLLDEEQKTLLSVSSFKSLIEKEKKILNDSIPLG